MTFKIDFAAIEKTMLAHVLDRPMMSCIKAQRVSASEFYRWEFAGVDPYNYHGRHMHNLIANYTHRITRITVVNPLPLDDPRNHWGRHA